jgi:hypothetical protein
MMQAETYTDTSALRLSRMAHFKSRNKVIPGTSQPCGFKHQNMRYTKVKIGEKNETCELSRQLNLLRKKIRRAVIAQSV